ncbi:predicted protein [Streptomyces sp. SPB78]|uniref:Uncharacterized protein n=1 Tax=Streptomyces phage SF3 TaxID=1690818 RepID=A0A0M4RBD4_9CAUD|nr:hypothetical protein [Streptomyces sp. SPB78]YP_009213199.1 hypothetical protein AVV12_gp72 [Streptomyces phage SF3]ALF00203.1 hypothetical protein SF3_720 [Streptomyces phage SF3]EFL00597.1 predicted protein [Streptomyces sp. SPB78]
MTEAHTLTERQLDELLADPAIPAAHRALWALLRDNNSRGDGLRLGDALSLSVGDIEFVDGPQDQGGRAGVDRPAKGEPWTVPISKHTAELLRQTIGDREAGPALHVDGRPISHEAASRTARAAGVDSVHVFRSWGKRHQGRPPRP